MQGDGIWIEGKSGRWAGGVSGGHAPNAFCVGKKLNSGSSTRGKLRNPSCLNMDTTQLLIIHFQVTSSIPDMRILWYFLVLTEPKS